MIDQPISNFMYRDVLSGEADTPLAEVIAQMNALGQSEFIVCESECPVGVISERDAISILNQALRGSDFAKVRAADVMVSPVQTLCETSMMSEVIGMMQERRFRRVPITNDKNELVGVVNLQDVQYALNTTLEQRGRDLEVAVMERTAELLKANQKLEELSIRDGLTGLLNRRAMTEKLVELHTRTQRYGNSYSVVLMDIDHFKNYNDSLGHVQGDEALRTISKLLVDAVMDYALHIPLYTIACASVIGLLLPDEIARPRGASTSQRVKHALPVLSMSTLALIVAVTWGRELHYDTEGHMQKGDLQMLSRAVRYAPTSPFAWYYYGRAMSRLQTPESRLLATRFLSRAGELDPNNYKLWYRIGNRKDKLGDRAGAAQAFARVKALRDWHGLPYLPEDVE